jgi:hypothetical protein
MTEVQATRAWHLVPSSRESWVIRTQDIPPFASTLSRKGCFGLFRSPMLASYLDPNTYAIRANYVAKSLSFLVEKRVF